MQKMGKFFSLFSSVIIVTFILFAGSSLVVAQQIPMGQDVGGLERARQEGKIKEAETKKLETPKEEPKIEDKEGVLPQQPAKPKLPETKVVINKIEVTGATVFKAIAINKITGQYEGKELSLSDFSDITAKITELYRSKGYVTSMAYLPPQKIENGVLKIDIIEGTVGKVNITGNKWFSTNLLTRYLGMKKDQIFNYDALKENVTYINQHPDRNASIVLVRGEDKGQTDVNVAVKDKLPLHATVSFNNYNSRYLDYRKYITEIKATNLWGMDHQASGEYQMGEQGEFFLYSARYMAPLTPRDKVGIAYVHVDQNLGGSVKALNIKGKGDIVSTYYSHKLVNDDNFTLSVNPGFDFKQIENKLLSSVQSKDNTRVAKLGFDIDLTDQFLGRNIITQEIDWGIPNFMGGLKSKDRKGSRAGAGGYFFKFITNAARVQALPANMSLMMRGAMQFSTTSLVSSEQFNIGGISTVRGYPLAQFSGDNGYNATAELYIPPYLVPKDLKIPYTKTNLFDSLRFLGFIDWGYVTLRNPQVGEKRGQALYGFGPGIRFDIPERCSVSLDYGYGFGQKPSEGDRSRIYIEAKVFF